jgi:hypothetical protein
VSVWTSLIAIRSVTSSMSLILSRRLLPGQPNYLIPLGFPILVSVFHILSWTATSVLFFTPSVTSAHIPVMATRKWKTQICVIKTSLMHYLSSVYFVNQPLHVSGIFVAHHQEEKHSTYQLLYLYIIPPAYVLQICPKHVEIDWRNKLRINSASSWFLLHRCIEVHCQQNIQLTKQYVLGLQFSLPVFEPRIFKARRITIITLLYSINNKIVNFIWWCFKGRGHF